MLRSKLISPDGQSMPPCVNKLQGKQPRIFFLLFIVLFPMLSMAQNITLKGENITLKQVFTEIKKQTNYAVVYSPEVVNIKLRVTIDASNQPLQQFLSNVLANHPYTFGVVGSNIFINKKEIIKVVQPDTSNGRNISGFVMDDKTTQPIRSVTITVNGSNQITQTDENGKFTLKNVPEKFTITLSCIGYDKIIRNVLKADGRLVVPMTQATSELDQVVIQAYGTTSRRMATGNIAKVAGEEIWKQPVMNPLIALQGKVAGLEITPTGSASSAPVKVEIRGRNSLNPNMLSEPLYVIDGIPQTVLEVRGANRYVQGMSAGVAQGGASVTNGQSPLFNMNPRDIESIEVLKDGDATAIYGSRGANGVILITTRRAKPGSTNFDVTINQGFIMPSRMPKMLNTQEYVAMRKEALQNAGIQINDKDAYDLTLWDTTRYTNWAKELMGTGRSTSANIGLSGGDARTSFRVGGEYTNHDDLNSRRGHNIRTGFSFAVNHKSSNQKLTVNLSGGYTYSDVNAIYDRTASYYLSPNAPAIFNDKGKLNYAGWMVLPTVNFPFDYLLNTNEVKTNTTNGRLSVSYDLGKGLSAGLGAGISSMQNKSDFFTPIAAQNPAANPTGRAVLGRTVNSNVIIEPELNYTNIIARGQLKVTLGATSQTATTTASTLVTAGYSNDDQIRSISNGTVASAVEGRENYRYAAVFGRIEYDWERKYIISLTGRRDGSSKFVRGKQYGNFGSIGLSWNASDEEWMSKLLPEWFSFLKFRGSAAVTGNDNVRSYEFTSQWASRLAGWNRNFYDYNGIRPFVQVVPPNQEFQWEVVKKFEGGIHLGFLDERINVEVATYLNRSGNQITPIPLPLYTGVGNVLTNWVAVVDNSGIEASISANVIKKNNLRWNLALTVGRNRNKLVKYPGLESSPFLGQLSVGESLNTKYLQHYLGVNPLTGEYMFEDRDKDGAPGSQRKFIPGIEDDYYIAVDMNPAFSGSLNSNFNYKNLSLSLNFMFKKGKGNNPLTAARAGAISNFILAEELMGDYWKKPGDIAKYPRIVAGGGNTLNLSDASIVDASFIRLNNISLGYSLPDKLLKMAKMKACTFSANVQNLFTITNYAMDPDILNGSLTPVQRAITATLQFTF